MVEKARFLDRLHGQLNARQHKVLVRMLEAGPAGFEGGMSAGKYVNIVNTSPATATRDLAELVEKGLLRRTGERKHARYHVVVGAEGSGERGADA